MEVHDQERRRIAEDVHDETIQALTAAGLRVQRLRRRVEDPDLAAIAADAEAAVARAVGDLRGLMVALLPEDAADGLAVLLRRVLAEELDPHEVAWDLDVDVPAEPSPAVSALVARTVREAVRNVARHADARQVTVRARGTAGAVEVSVVDDGRGFDAEAPVPPGHLGLRTMRHRLERAGGWWRVDSSPGEGAAVRFGLPC